MSSAVWRLADWDAGRLAELADTHGTPLYVQDLERVRENYARMADAFPESEVMYAAKANTAEAVLTTLVEAGAGIECASAGEVERALSAGAPPERVQYTAVNPPADDLDYAVRTAREHPELTITAGARDTIDRLAERGFSGRLCLRVNPGVGAGHHEKVSTGANAKFGVPIERAPELLAEADERGFDVVGIHAHAGSGISGEDLAAHRELVSRMGELARETAPDLEFVDIGGGFGVPYREDEEPLDLAAVADATREALGEVDATLVVEPGRYLVADAGVLLTRVNTVKPAGDERVVGVDAGMTHLARPAMYDAHHAIRSLADTGDRGIVEATVTGPICESGDVFGSYALPNPARGDLLAIGNAGAYGYEMASQYNSRPRPATVVLDGEESAVDRRRETIEDVMRLDRGAPWL
ncbi:diaminopimelate decarboxylase [Halalkalicoccus tibetensis]|uniref:Diaminopimelate decarboxylase n=1 Tax=Halalkalicoccus tibetensis TaxID=175632 RepID=A0ABD5V0B7_9EURY